MLGPCALVHTQHGSESADATAEGQEPTRLDVVHLTIVLMHKTFEQTHQKSI